MGGLCRVFHCGSKRVLQARGCKRRYAIVRPVRSILSRFRFQQIDGIFSTVPDALAEAAAGVPIQAVWVTDLSKGGDVVVGSSAITRPQDLKGKRIGLSYGTYSQIFVLTGLAKYGIKASDVQIINLPGEQVPDALLHGQIDAGHTWDPHVTQVLASGGHTLFTSQDAPVVEILCFNKLVIEKRPDDIRAVLRAGLRGLDYWKQHPAEGDRIIASAVGVKVTDLAGFFKGDAVYGLPENQAAFDPQTSDPVALSPNFANASSLFLDSKVIQKAPNIPSIIDASFVGALAGRS